MSKKQTHGDISQAMAILVGTHSPNLQTCGHDLTITLSCPKIKQTDGDISQLFAIAGLGSKSKTQA